VEKEREHAEAEAVATRAAEEEVRQAQEKARAAAEGVEQAQRRQVTTTGKASEVVDVDVEMGEAAGAGPVAGTTQGKVSPFEFFAHTPFLTVRSHLRI
jgi:hypothetical protein